jgi:NADH:ubiquinone oxidoreductase subunit E
MHSKAQRNLLLTVASLALVVLLACVTILVFDFVVARHQKPLLERRVAKLQQRVQTDASAADDLAAEQFRQAEAVRGRKAKSEKIAYVLIAAAAAFLTSVKWHLSGTKPRPLPFDRLVQVNVSAPPKPAAASVPHARPRDRRDLYGADEGNGSFVDQVIAETGTSSEGAIAILQAIQSHYGYLPEQATTRVCELTEITPAQIVGTSTFYAGFRHSPMGRHMIRVCHGTACHVAGARHITEELHRHLAIPAGSDTDPQRVFTVDKVACLGCCSLAPVLMVDDQTAGRLTPVGVRDLLVTFTQEQTA